MLRSELETMVLERLGVDSSRTAFVTQIDGHLDREYVMLVTELNLNRSTADLDVTAANPVVPLPTDFLKAISVRGLGSSVAAAGLIPVDPTKMVRLQAQEDASGITGNAVYYSIEGLDRMEVFPTPTTTAADVIRMNYVARPALLTTAGTAPSKIPAEFHGYLAEKAIYHMAQNQEDPGMSQQAAANAAAIKQLLRETIAAAPGESSTRIRRAVYG